MPEVSKVKEEIRTPPANEEIPAAPLEEELTDKKIESEITKAGAKEGVSCLDPDFILIALFAVFVDALDVVLEIVGVFVAEIPKIVSIPLDIATFAIIGGWSYWRTGRIANSKKEAKDKIKKHLEKLAKRGGKATKQLEKGTKTLAKTVAKPASRSLLRGGAALIGEIIPLIGLIPFWTITVISMLREK
jgi:hypothetical protein